MHAHGQAGTLGWLTLQVPSQLAVSLHVAAPFGTPPTPPHTSCEYCAKLHSASELQSSRLALRRQGRKVSLTWHALPQPAPKSTPHDASLAQAMSQRCLSVRPPVTARSGCADTAMSLPDIIIGVELPQAIKSNRLRMRPASTVVRSRSSVRCNHPVIDLTELIDMEHLESERNMRPLAGRVGPVALLVERQSASRELTDQLLREQGFHVVVVADGAAGLETARRLRPVLVVTEILLAELDGLALCRRIKEQAPATRVLLLSALSAAARARDAGADGFLSKPISHPKLAAAVDGLLPAHLEEHG